VSETTFETLPPENDPFAAPVNHVDVMAADTELDPLSLGTPAQIQAMLEEPTGVHQVDDGVDGGSTSVIETAHMTEPGVELRRQEPVALLEERTTQVLSAETGAQAGGERP
jgi:hypothetical protein